LQHHVLLPADGINDESEVMAETADHDDIMRLR
jgi:hypothetical protein